MKNKKIKYISIIIIVLLFSAHTAFALKRAIFPDGQSLQPIPKNVYPNVSGNVNATTTTLPQYQPSNTGTPETTVDSQVSEVKTEKTTSLLIWPFILIIAIAIFFTYRKYHKNKASEKII